MKKFGMILAAFIVATSGVQHVYAAGKPTALPTPKANQGGSSEKANPSALESKSGVTNSSSAPGKSQSNPGASDSGKATPQGNNSSEASDTAKQKANENSAVNRSQQESTTAGIDNGPTKRYIIRYNDNSALSVEIKSLTDKKIKVDRTVSKVFKGAVANLTEKQLETLKKNPNIAGIEADSIVTTTEFQSTSSWGLDRIDQRTLPLDSGYTYTSTGASSTIFVVDTGIRSTHTELSGRVLSGYTSIADGNGTNDCNGHGTHVSGIAAGRTTGVAKSATLVPVRVLDCSGSGSTSGVIAGLDWIASISAAGAPAVVNMSLGGGASSALDTAVNNLISRGMTVVVAAGNSTADACLSSPSRVTNAITVAASALGDSFASYSNYGSCTDIIAPGSNINSSWISSDLGYATLSGTSMATPFVSGVAALILSGGYQTATNVFSVVKQAATSNVISGVVGTTPNLLLFSAINVNTQPAPINLLPTAPSNVVAIAQKRSASLTWAPASDNGSPLTGQVLKIYSPGKSTIVKSITATATSLTVTGLNANNTYTFTVAAINKNGTGPESSPSNAIKPLR